MNTDMLAGDWNMLKGKIRETWGKLTNDVLDVIAGKRDQLVGAIQRHYGMSKEIVMDEIANFERLARSAAPPPPSSAG